MRGEARASNGWNGRAMSSLLSFVKLQWVIALVLAQFLHGRSLGAPCAVRTDGPRRRSQIRFYGPVSILMRMFLNCAIIGGPAWS